MDGESQVFAEIPDRTHCHASFCLNTILNGEAAYTNEMLVDFSSNGFRLFHWAVKANLDPAIKSVAFFFFFLVSIRVLSKYLT